MPEKSRQRRVQVAKRQGKSTAIKSTDVGLAKGLSTHAAKKSSHVEGMRSVAGRSVSRKAPPLAGKGRGTRTPVGPHESARELPDAQTAGKQPRVRGVERHRAEQKILSRRTPSSVAAKQARKKAPAKKK